MRELNSIVYTPTGSRVATGEDMKEFQEALREMRVQTFHEAICAPLNKWKRQMTNTPVKAKKYKRDMHKFLTGKEVILPNIKKLRTIIHK